MWTKIKQWWKSHTIKSATFIALMGIVEVNFHLLQETLGQYYGLSFMAIALLMGYLRHITTKPINEK